jgi:peptidyl-prolyl cis-trans isomerase C
MRSDRLFSRACLAALVTSGLSLALPPLAGAQTPPAAGTAPTTMAPAPAGAQAQAPVDPNTVVATVNGQEIHLADVSELTRNLPQQLQGMPPDQLYPILLEQLVDQKAMAIAARKEGLENDPLVQKRIAVGIDQVLQGALVSKVIGPAITEDAVKAAYDRDYANQPGIEEVHARHILVSNEQQAKDIIKQLDHGADFAKLAKKYSKDPGAANGGDLGYFKKTDMVPEFATAAFALKDGQITQTPVHTQFGYHVIQVLGHKTDPAPSLADVHDKIRNDLIQENVHKLLAQVRSQVTIKEFGPDGTPMAGPNDKPAAGAPAAGAPAGGAITAPAATPAPAKPAAQ